jgi:drug/metabolite transporter (DMT)-like permease
LSIVEPITALILAIIILGESFSIIQTLAIIVIILGLFFTSKSEAV